MAFLSHAMAASACSPASRAASAARVFGSVLMTAAVTARIAAAVYRLSMSLRLSFSHISAVERQPAESLTFSKCGRRLYMFYGIRLDAHYLQVECVNSRTSVGL